MTGVEYRIEATEAGRPGVVDVRVSETLSGALMLDCAWSGPDRPPRLWTAVWPVEGDVRLLHDVDDDGAALVAAATTVLDRAAVLRELLVAKLDERVAVAAARVERCERELAAAKATYAAAVSARATHNHQ